MSYTEPATDPFPATQTPDEWLLKAYDSGWMRNNSSTANRGYLANFREDHRATECNDICIQNPDAARWPYYPSASRFLGPVTAGSELYQQLMGEELPTLSPAPDVPAEEAA